MKISVGQTHTLEQAYVEMHEDQLQDIIKSLGIDLSLYNSIKNHIKPLNDELIQAVLPKRCRNTHKGDYGHVLIVGGDYGMGGAVRMAAEAAMRVGSGLVTVATRPEYAYTLYTSRPEAMCYPIRVKADLAPLVARASVIVVGPGLGQENWSESLLQYVLDQPHPKVVDADALNLIAKMPHKPRCDHWVLTPHPGEAARLLKQSLSKVQAHRYLSVQALQKNYGGIALLKGAGSLIQLNSKDTRICLAGNPGMASGGMGDVLSGVLGGLLAQGLTLADAACVGVQLHARAADLAASEAGERGLLASDLLPYLRRLVNY